MPVKGVGEGYGVSYASALGITGTGPEALQALRKTTPAQLKEIAAAPNPGGGNARPMRPMIDGTIMPETPAEAFAAGHELQIPYMTGGTSFEASLNPNINKTPEVTLARAGALRDAIVAVYGGDPGNAAYDFQTESGIIEPARKLAWLHARNGNKTWAYYASYLPASERGKVHGLNHGGEIRYVFGNLSDKPTERGGRTVAAATPEDWAMSKSIQAYWVAFAKNPDPGSAGGPAWPAYDPKLDNFIEFGIDGIQLRPHFHQASLDLLE